MNLRAGTVITLARRMVWDDVEHPDDRTPGNGTHLPQTAHVVGCDWAPPLQRMVVRLETYRGQPFCLTRHELELNGATQ